MNSSLAYLPEEKQKRILDLVETIKEVSPAMIILHGSYAKGTQQQGHSEEDNAIKEFNSDIDFLVVMKDGNDIKESSIADQLHNKLANRGLIIDIIVQSIDNLNRYLERGQFFFLEIINTGIVLFDSGEVQLAMPKILTREERRELTVEYFDFWFPLSKKYYDVAVSDFEKSVEQGTRLNFSLHNLFQATEGLYSTLLLVFAGHKPKTHNLDKYRRFAKGISHEVDSTFPLWAKDRHEKDLFELLKRSYVGAKYKLDFQIPQKDLEQLIKKVGEFMKIVEKLCLEQIAALS